MMGWPDGEGLAGEVRGSLSGLSREAVRGGLTDGARGVGPGLPSGPQPALLAVDLSGLVEACSTNPYADRFDMILRQQAAIFHAVETINVIRLLAAHSWVWSAVGLAEFFEGNR